jgi:hypothetical protein
MFRNIFILAIITFKVGSAAAEPVTGSEFFEDRSGYPCAATLSTDVGKAVTLQLSDYKDVWSLTFIVSNRASVYRQFFDSRGLHEGDAFEEAFRSVRIGKRTFVLHEASLFEVQREDVDEKSFGVFDINEQHNVVRALEAMREDGIVISGLISLEGTADTLIEFRTCSYAAMGLQEGERVERDFRAEYRMIFEDAFENWVKSMARAETCLAARFNGDAVDEVIDAASDAFYPGLFSLQKRGEYVKDLERKLPLAKLSGMAEAKSDGCLMAGRLAEMSRLPVDSAIEAASDLD